MTFAPITSEERARPFRGAAKASFKTEKARQHYLKGAERLHWMGTQGQMAGIYEEAKKIDDENIGLFEYQGALEEIEQMRQMISSLEKERV